MRYTNDRVACDFATELIFSLRLPFTSKPFLLNTVDIASLNFSSQHSSAGYYEGNVETSTVSGFVISLIVV